MKIGKKLLLISVLVVVLSASIFAGHNWKRVNYMDSTIFSAIVTVDNKPAKAGDIVGAFVGSE
ncbi:MAG: hypothetical protein IPO21_04480 [Bacteroidales bacterium]|nr:hypothetical protein [Bacteroidales bacterium]